MGLPLLAIAILALVFAAHAFRYRFVRSDGDMLDWLPRVNAATFYANVAALRQSGLLGFLAGSKRQKETEYEEFVRATHFDYAKDLDAVAGAVANGQVFFLLRGRFDWGRLRGYVLDHRGSCAHKLCSVPTTTPGRWASFFSLQPDVMLLALSRDRLAAEKVRSAERQPRGRMPRQAVWVKISQDVLKNPMGLPEPVRIFAMSVQWADAVILSIDRTSGKADAWFELRLDAECPSQATAETIRNQLEIQTKMLKLELLRERQQPNPADLTGLLTAGSFEVNKTHAIGRWPVQRELVESLQ